MIRSNPASSGAFSAVGATVLLVLLTAPGAEADVYQWNGDGQLSERDAVGLAATSAVRVPFPETTTPQARRLPAGKARYRDLAYRIALGLSGEPGVRAVGLSATEWAELFVALVARESAFDPRAVSTAGAQGLAQLMPATAAELGVTDPFDPAENLDAGARYLAAQLQRFGDVALALAAYNAGPERVLSHHGVPPFAETRAYVAAVLSTAGLASSADDGAAPLPVATTEKAIWQW